MLRCLISGRIAAVVAVVVVGVTATTIIIVAVTCAIVTVVISTVVVIIVATAVVVVVVVVVSIISIAIAETRLWGMVKSTVIAIRAMALLVKFTHSRPSRHYTYRFVFVYVIIVDSR